ncbi:MAG: hypothetical protein AAF650_03195 [Pseudomonadota bacterium]
MKRRFNALAVAVVALAVTASPSLANTQAETYEAYLARLSEICAVECLKPKQLRRKARRRSENKGADLAVMMDVAYIRRVGTKAQLLSVDLERSVLEDLAILGSAGIDVSGRTGAGGLPRSRDGNLTPDTVVIELDKQALSDLLNTPLPAQVNAKRGDGKPDIIVEGEAEPAPVKPTLAALSGLLLNRRVVVRGSPRLTPVWVGGRKDYRNKQVTLEVANADDLALLPRFDDEGEPIKDALPWAPKAASPDQR